MPKNKGKGGKNRRRGKNENEGLKRELVIFFYRNLSYLIGEHANQTLDCVVQFIKVKRQFLHLKTSFWHFKHLFFCVLKANFSNTNATFRCLNSKRT